MRVHDGETLGAVIPRWRDRGVAELKEPIHSQVRVVFCTALDRCFGGVEGENEVGSQRQRRLDGDAADAEGKRNGFTTRQEQARRGGWRDFPIQTRRRQTTLKQGVRDVDLNILVAGVGDFHIPCSADASVIIHGRWPVLNLDEEQRCHHETEGVNLEFFTGGSVQNTNGDRVQCAVGHAVIVGQRWNINIKRARVGRGHVKTQGERSRCHGPVAGHRSFHDDIFNEIAVVDEGEINGLRFARNNTDFFEGADHKTVLLTDVAKNVGREVQAGFDVGDPNGGVVVGGGERVGGWCEAHAHGGFVASTNLDHGGRFEHEIDFTGVRRIEVDTKGGGRVAVVANDDARGDRLTDGEVHGLAGRREGGVDFLTHANGHLKGSDVGPRRHLEHVDADGFYAVGRGFGVRGENEREGGDVC